MLDDILNTATNIIIKDINTNTERYRSIVETLRTYCSSCVHKHIDDVIVSRYVYHIYTEYVINEYSENPAFTQIFDLVASNIDWHRVCRVTGIFSEIASTVNR